MENSMVVNVDNNSFLDSDVALTLIKELFEKRMPLYNLKKEFNNGTYRGYGVEYESRNVKIFIGGEQGGLDYSVEIDRSPYYLPDFDNQLKDVYAASENNIHFLFNVMEKFIETKMQ